MPEVEPPRHLLPPMDAPHLDDFLGAPRQSGHLATVRSGGTPQVGPVWFYWDRPTLWIVTFRSSARVKNVRREPEVAFSVDANRFPATGCVLYGCATEEELRADVIERIVERYVPRQRVPAFVARYLENPDRVLLRIDVSRTIAWNASGSTTNETDE